MRDVRGIRLLVLRVLWVTLPATAGTAVADTLESWSDAPRVTATVICWLAWGAGTVALLAPRPVGLTTARVLAPTFAAVAIAVAVDGSSTTLAAGGAVAATLAVAVLVAGPDLAFAAAAGVAYGDELRFPLRTPPALFLGPLWMVRALVAAAIAAGPLLLADGRVGAGVAAVAVGIPVVVLGARALHGLSRRWLVVVPAGVVVVDPLTLSDPVLLVRRLVRIARAGDARPALPPDALDLRLGATLGTVVLELEEPVELVRAARGRHGGTTVRAPAIVVAVARSAEALAAASRRRVRVEAR